MIKNLSEVGENLQKVVQRLLANQTLIKLLYYTDKDPLNQVDLTTKQIEEEIYENLVKVVPKLKPQKTAVSMIALRVEKGTKNPENDEFRNIVLKIEVFVPLTQWLVKSNNLRPFLIMGEIQKSLDGKTVNGLGKIVGGDFEISFLTEEMSAYEMTFKFITYD